MIFEILAEPFGAGAIALAVRWDSDSGALSGRDAGLVRTLVADAIEAGGVAGHPMPWWIAIDDEALHDPAQMAAILGEAHRLPEALAAHYPAPPIEGESDAEVLY